jgi:hypothetical protein
MYCVLKFQKNPRIKHPKKNSRENMQAEDRLNEVDRPFFGNTLYPPLIAKEPSSCITSRTGWKCIKVTGCIAGTTRT